MADSTSGKVGVNTILTEEVGYNIFLFRKYFLDNLVLCSHLLLSGLRLRMKPALCLDASSSFRCLTNLNKKKEEFISFF